MYVAGGPTAEVRVFDRRGRRLADARDRRDGSFLNDGWIGDDGAAYVTDSSLPLIWRVSERRGQGGSSAGSTSRARSPTRRR